MSSAAGTLVSLITKPKQPELLSSVHELVRQDEMPWLIEAGSGFTNMGNDAEEGTTLKYEKNSLKYYDRISKSHIYFQFTHLGDLVMELLLYQERVLVMITLSGSKVENILLYVIS